MMQLAILHKIKQLLPQNFTYFGRKRREIFHNFKIYGGRFGTLSPHSVIQGWFPPPGKTQNFQFLAKNFPPQPSEKVSSPPKNTIFKENFQIYRIFSTDHHTPDIILTDNQTNT